MISGHLGVALLWIGLIATFLTIGGYGLALARPQCRKTLWTARLFYSLTALCVLGTFGTLAYLVYSRQYQYLYPWEHTSNDLHGWFRLAATWAGQEGSFLLWGAWTAIIGFLVFTKAAKYEARVMPFFVSILGFLCAILIKQTPFGMIPIPSVADLAANPSWHYPPLDGQGLNPSLVNYWMTIHPPTIFFGFASLAVPFCYAIAALIWKDYERWTPRVMPYALLSCATLGLGLFMGGYWAYETQGWHGFWAWDPVENASFFPWLAITALVHGSVVQKDRGGMARTNTFLGILAFWLFLLGTFLTRSGALASKGADGQLLSVHAFDDIGKSALWLMASMLIIYGTGGLLLWLFRLRQMPRRQTTGETLVSRDFAFFLAVLLMLIACAIVTLGATWPLTLSLLHKTPDAPKAAFYNKTILPVALLAALVMGCVPWLAWRKTDPEKFLKKLLIPWFAMIGFGFFLLFWVLGAERAAQMLSGQDTVVLKETMHAWISPSVQRIAVVALASLGFFAALSNAMLAYRVFRAKPLSAGGWLAHVGIGVLMIGIIVSNTYERTERVALVEGDVAKEVFGYKFAFEKMTGKPMEQRPVNPDYDKNNAVQLAVTSGNEDANRFSIAPRWFVYNMNTSPTEDKFQRMYWPSIEKYAGHDLYVSLANDPIYEWPSDDPTGNQQGIILKPKEKRKLGPYVLGYYNSQVDVGKDFFVQLALLTPDSKVLQPHPGLVIQEGQMTPVDITIPELRDARGNPGVIYLDRLTPGTREAVLRVSLPEYAGRWIVPLEITYKPWINLVWLGVIIAVSGIVLAMIRRTREMPADVEPVTIVPGKSTAPTPVKANASDRKPGASPQKHSKKRTT